MEKTKPQDNVPKVQGMKNEPKVIYLNCYDEAESDPSYLPIDNDFETLEGEYVLWSANSPCLSGHIKYVHHSELTDAKSLISALEKQNAVYRKSLEEIIIVDEEHYLDDVRRMKKLAKQALNPKEANASPTDPPE